MATSVIEICNRALRAIGEEPITSLGDAGTNASLCSLHYEPVRDAVLRAHPWKFAAARAALAVSGTPAFDYDHYYALPAGCLRIQGVYSNAGVLMDDARSWVQEGRSIATDEDAPLYLLYTQRIEDPTQHDPLFDEALACRLAATIADDRSKPANLVDRQWQLYQRKIAEAQYVDSTQAAEPEEYVSKWEEVRG